MTGSTDLQKAHTLLWETHSNKKSTQTTCLYTVTKPSSVKTFKQTLWTRVLTAPSHHSYVSSDLLSHSLLQSPDEEDHWENKGLALQDWAMSSNVQWIHCNIMSPCSTLYHFNVIGLRCSFIFYRCHKSLIHVKEWKKDRDRFKDTQPQNQEHLILFFRND